MTLGEAEEYFQTIAEKDPQAVFPYRLSAAFSYRGLYEVAGFELLDCPMTVNKALYLIDQATKGHLEHYKGAMIQYDDNTEFVFCEGWDTSDSESYTKDWICKLDKRAEGRDARTLFDLAFGLKPITFEYWDYTTFLLCPSTGKPLGTTYQVNFGVSEKEVHSFDFPYWVHDNPLDRMPTHRFTVFKGTAKEFEAELKRLKLPYEKTIG